MNIDLTLTTIKQQLPAFIHEETANFSAASNTYHNQPEELRKMIAMRHNIPLEYVFLTAGADQAIMLLSIVFGQSTHIFTPTYISYTDVNMLGGTLTEHSSLKSRDYSVATDRIAGASLVFLANPNNPAGFTKKDAIFELVKNNPNTIIAIDEAYGDFTDLSVANEAPEYKNLVVIRSFSKGFGLAGYRIGYLLAHPEVIKKFYFETTWFNVAYTSVGAALSALKHEDYFKDIRSSITAERKTTEEFFTNQGYSVIPSFINAVLLKFDTESSAELFSRRLRDAGILVNHGNGGSNCGLNKTYVRIGIGTPQHMQALRTIVMTFS